MTVDDSTIIVCSAIISAIVVVVGFYLDAKIDHIIQLIFKDKLTYTPQTPTGASRLKQKYYKGKCPVCGTKVSSKRNECPMCGQRLNWRTVKRKELHK